MNRQDAKFAKKAVESTYSETSETPELRGKRLRVSRPRVYAS
jgi:hypothetical protein